MSYAAGLLSGFGGALLPALLVAGLVAAAAVLRRLASLAGLALVLAAGAVVSATADREARRCDAAGDGARRAWRVRLGTEAVPGAAARGTLAAPCALRVVLLVREGRAPGGALVVARAAPV